MTLPDDPHILGPADQFGIEAIGQPGDRRFRILVRGPGGDATIWLEKEDMSRLAVSVEQLLQMVRRNVEQAASRQTNLSELPSESPSQSFEFQSGSWAVGYLESAHVIEFQAHDIEDEDDSQPRLSFWVTMAQSRDWSTKAMEIYSAGRPLCPLCQGPMNPGQNHVCPMTNGHHSATVGGS